jgi:hypothetical protein
MIDWRLDDFEDTLREMYSQRTVKININKCAKLKCTVQYR